MRTLHLHVISDSHGETADVVSKSVFMQYPDVDYTITRHAFIRSVDDITSIMQALSDTPVLVIYTLVIEELREHLEYMAYRLGIKCIDVMGPVMDAVTDFLGSEPEGRAGRVERLDDDYFKRIDAIEFAVKYDDGKDYRGVLKADLTLIGISRTSKTPLSMYMANRGYKVANIPLVPEVEPPKELFQIDRRRIIGLVADPNRLNGIRSERLRAMGLAPGASNYAQMDRIRMELLHSEEVMRKLRCQVIDVSSRAIEETAGIILEMMAKSGIA